tara:strand:- start:1675 stop:1977 length:303 start_codon:yes stop_codon:yes gene_type:complete
MSEETPVIRFFRGSKPIGVVAVVPNAPILEMAEIAGVQIPTNCTSGTCGTCLVTLREGEVDLPEELPPGLDDELVELGGTLTCCINPKGSCDIDVIPPAW